MYLKVLSCLILLHTIAFFLEFFYQKLCYPLTLLGFFQNLFINDNSICNNIRIYSIKLQSFVSNIIIYIFTICIMSLMRLVQAFIRTFK